MQLIVSAKLTPVAIIQPHHRTENALWAVVRRRCFTPLTLWNNSLVSLLVEEDVSVEAEHHEEDEGSIKEDKAVLGDVCIVCAMGKVNCRSSGGGSAASSPKRRRHALRAPIVGP